jgi:hypothetical protein
MTFTVTVTFKPHDAAPVKSKTIKGVDKIERAWEKIAGENYEVLRVYESGHNWATWGIKGILHISMSPELE